MENASQIKLTCFMERFRDKHHERGFFWHGPQIAEVVEMVVEAVDPKIRAVSRYNKQLRTPVEKAWNYLDSLIDQIPGQMRISKRRYSIDPRVRVIFDSVGDMLKTFQESPAVTEFFHSNEEAEDSYVLLSMEKKEHTFLGMELAGEMLKRDVLQTSVSFSNHHLMTPSTTELGAKEGIKCYAFEGLLHKARQLILDSHRKTRQLEETKQQVTRELRQAKSSAASVQESASVERLEKQLHDVERELVEARMETGSPNRHLQIIIDVLSDPKNYINIKHELLSLSNLGIKLEGEAAKHAHVIEIAEIEIAKTLKRSAMVASFPRRDLW